MTTRRPPDPEVFVKAAERCFDAKAGNYCCTSLYAAAAVLHGLTDEDRKDLEVVEEVAFHRMFLPDGARKRAAYFGSTCPGEPSTAANTEHRVLSLLLAAEIIRNPEDVP